ncbi:tRNA lysidine(34) synthetase TilS [Thauera sedimentorum]|uniref:tRNA lysidine(34) synthetase TilS n=1 Tax=Thauera sedimentorum TaxID=2767595 RepID=UPI0032E800F3
MTASPPALLQDELAAVLAAAGVGEGATLCCALSGGVDSVLLLHGLAALRETLGFRLVAAHVHHGLSPNADDWAASCAGQCARLGVSLQTFHVAVDRGDPAGLEAAARRVRHAALRRVACDWLVFGHHQDDQAETLLFRLARGAGVRGAGGMAAVEPGAPGRLRPLLGVRRARIEQAARDAGLVWVNDESNADLRHTRNALRHRVLPALEAVFPAAVPALARAAENFREADELLDALAAEDALRCGGRRLSREALCALPSARLRNLLRWRMRDLGVEPVSRARLIETERQLRETAPGRPLRLPLGELACCVYRDELWLERALPANPVALCWRGETRLGWGDGAVAFEATLGRGLSAAALGKAGEVWLAPRWPGLAMRLQAGRPRRSFKNLCQEAGVPPWLRDRLPVLRVDGEAVWIAGIGVAAGWQCAAGEEGVLPVWQHGGISSGCR